MTVYFRDLPSRLRRLLEVSFFMISFQPHFLRPMIAVYPFVFNVRVSNIS
jgi:hypothetical protein